MGDLSRRQPLHDGDRHGASRKSGSPPGVSAGRNARSDRDRSDRVGHLSAAFGSTPMTVTHATHTGARALLVAGRSDHAELEALLRGMGYQTVMVNGSDQVAALREPVSLCLIDLRQNGEALRSARAMRAQHPHSVVIGVADPGRPSAAAEAIRAGVFDWLRRSRSQRCLEALLANAREQLTLACAKGALP